MDLLPLLLLIMAYTAYITVGSLIRLFPSSITSFCNIFIKLLNTSLYLPYVTILTSRVLLILKISL